MPSFQKIGRIFNLEPSSTRLTTHAQVPTILVMEDVVRVYFAARNAEGKSYPTFVDLARSDLTRIVHVQKHPIISFGQPGAFDDDGIMPAHVVKQPDGIWMYYSGWNRRVTIPYHNSTGLAISRDGGACFERKFEGPVMDRTHLEPYLAVTPSILIEGDKWRVWYISGIRWVSIAGKYEPVYVIKYGESGDGIHWDRRNKLCIEQRHPLEAFSHPTIIKNAGVYHMWYCYRHSVDYRNGEGSYKIGYARSTNGIDWSRLDDEAGLPASSEGWDSAMQCYPYVCDIDGKVYLFYNGNGFGQSGIGIAKLERW